MSSFSSTTTTAAADLRKRQTTRYTLPQVGIGCRHEVLFHDYYPINHATGAHPAASNTIPDADWFAEDRVYIQSSLHADELPGLLVTQHLIKLLDIAASEGRIQKQITIVPYANPLGLNQFIHTYHQGRFSTLTGTNFNRDWMDISKAVVAKISQATKDGTISSSISKEKKVGIVRRFMYEEILAFEASKPEKIWKKELFKRSAISSIVLDLHCDSGIVELHLNHLLLRATKQSCLV
jgi:predicted deacylase